MNFLTNGKVALGICLLMGALLIFTWVPPLRQMLVTNNVTMPIDLGTATTTVVTEAAATKVALQNESAPAIPDIKKQEVVDPPVGPVRDYEFKYVNGDFTYDSSIAWQPLQSGTFKYDLEFINSFTHEGGLMGRAIASTTKGFYYDSSENPGCPISFHIISSTSISYSMSDEEMSADSGCSEYRGARAFFMPDKIHVFDPIISKSISQAQADSNSAYPKGVTGTITAISGASVIGKAPLTVHFNLVNKYSQRENFLFGDEGSVSTGPTDEWPFDGVIHTYVEPGTYTATLSTDALETPLETYSITVTDK